MVIDFNRVIYVVVVFSCFLFLAPHRVLTHHFIRRIEHVLFCGDSILLCMCACVQENETIAMNWIGWMNKIGREKKRESSGMATAFLCRRWRVIWSTFRKHSNIENLQSNRKHRANGRAKANRRNECHENQYQKYNKYYIFRLRRHINNEQKKIYICNEREKPCFLSKEINLMAIEHWHRIWLRCAFTLCTVCVRCSLFAVSGSLMPVWSLTRKCSQSKKEAASKSATMNHKNNNNINANKKNVFQVQ